LRSQSASRSGRALSLESLLNDGIAYALVFLPAAFLTSDAHPVQHWLREGLLHGVGLSLAAGAVAGWSAGKLLQHARRRGFLERPAFLAYSIALSLLTVGGLSLLGVNAILGVAVAGLVFALFADEEVRSEHERIQETMNRVVTLPLLLVLGAVLPWREWLELGWTALPLAVVLLFVRRPLVVLALAPYMKTVCGTRQALFTGWFGPIGIGALYYASELRGYQGGETVWSLTTLAVSASVLAHGMTAAPFARWLGRERSMCAAAAPENAGRI
jgi:NhaP-type Na+/H+ or K+/H+ antiporter